MTTTVEIANGIFFTGDTELGRLFQIGLACDWDAIEYGDPDSYKF